MRTVASAGLLSLKLERATETFAQEFFVRLRRDDASDKGDIVCSYPAFEGRYSLLPEGFDACVYYERNGDVKAADVDPYDHYLQYCRHEGRKYR